MSSGALQIEKCSRDFEESVPSFPLVRYYEECMREIEKTAKGWTYECTEQPFAYGTDEGILLRKMGKREKELVWKKIRHIESEEKLGKLKVLSKGEALKGYR